MHQSRFETEASPHWQRLERLLDELPGRRLSARQKAELEEMPALYRQVCSDYGLALKRRYTTGLAGRLHTLVLRGHHLIYQQRGQGLRDLIRFIGITFPSGCGGPGASSPSVWPFFSCRRSFWAMAPTGTTPLSTA